MIRRLHGGPFGGKEVEIIFDAAAQVTFTELIATLEVAGSYTMTEEDYDLDGVTLLETRVTDANSLGTATKTYSRTDFDAQYIDGGISLPDEVWCAVREGRWIWPALIRPLASSAVPGAGDSILAGASLSIDFGSDGVDFLAQHIERTVTPPTGDPDYDTISVDYHDSVTGAFLLGTATTPATFGASIALTLGTDYPSIPYSIFVNNRSPTEYGPATLLFDTDIQRAECALQEIIVNVSAPADNPGPFHRVYYTDWTLTFTYRLEAA